MSKTETGSWLDRVGVERSELVERRAKLGTFLESEEFKRLPVSEQILLGKQYDAMCEYETILTQRIENALGENDPANVPTDWWVLAHGGDKSPVDCVEAEDGMLLFQTEDAAEEAAKYQCETYGIDCIAIRLTELNLNGCTEDSDSWSGQAFSGG